MVRTRTQHRGLHQESSALGRTVAARKKKNYKILMEAVTQQKKKLRSEMSYQAKAPFGYTFVPLGNPALTDYCKEKCRLQNLVAYTVSAQPKNKPKPAQSRPQIDTQRIGHHFPNQVIALACDVLGYTCRKGVFVQDSHNYEETRIARSLREYERQHRQDGRNSTTRHTQDKIQSAIREVFPNIPDSDMDGIVNHAFQEGTERVGNAKELTLARRVQLAVGAYIRHRYTDYDKYLKLYGWQESRFLVNDPVYEKMKEWQGEADCGNELEEIFREILVIDDDDEDEDEDDSGSSDGDGAYYRDDSLEIVSSHATAHELQPEYDHSTQLPLENSSARPAPRSHFHAQSAQQVDLTNSYNSYSHGPRQHLHRAEAIIQPQHPYAIAPQSGSQQRAPPTPARQKIMQGPDGRLYALEPIPPSSPKVPGDVPHLMKRFASRDVTYMRGTPPAPQLLRRLSGEDVVLPTIERDMAPLPPRPLQGARSREQPAYTATFPSHQSVTDPSRRKEEYNYVYTSTRQNTQQYGVTTMVPRVEPRVPPLHEIIDLTYSPPKRTEVTTGYRLMPVSKTRIHPWDHAYENRYADLRR